MEDSAIDFKIFTSLLEKQVKIFFFCVSGLFFFQDSYIPVSIQNSLHEGKDHVYLLILLSLEST